MPVDKQLSGVIGEHAVCVALARRGWLPALTPEGFKHTDILARKVEEGDEGRMIAVQVKTARSDAASWSWALGKKGTSLPAPSVRNEYYVLVQTGTSTEADATRFFVVPKLHVAAATWLSHMSWLAGTPAKGRKRTAEIGAARVSFDVFERYEGRWDLLETDEADQRVLLPSRYRDLISEVRLPENHPWLEALPPAW